MKFRLPNLRLPNVRQLATSANATTISDYEQYLLQIINDPSTPSDQRAHAIDDLRLREDTRTTLGVIESIILIGFLVAFVAQFCLVWNQRQTQGTWYLFGSALLAALWASAWCLGGTVLGFLFGIPHTQQQAPSGPNAVTPAYAQRVNTNLEQISDWLTKIIVGVGLVQLLKLPPALTRAAMYMANCGIHCAPFAAAIVIVFLAAGFLLGYLATRMYLAPAFGRADRASNGTERAANELPPPLPGKQTEESTSASPNPTIRKAAIIASAPPTGVESFARTHARAKLLAYDRQFSDAASIYATLIERSPDDPTIRLEYAWALFKSTGAFSPLIEAQLKHVLSLDTRLTREARRDLYESLTFYYLYQEPDGYNTSIRYGETYLALPTHLASAEVYVNLACAYGQAHHHAAALQDKSELKLKALNCIKQALKLNADKVKPLRDQLLGTTSGENDLSDFMSDPDFRTALGLN